MVTLPTLPNLDGLIGLARQEGVDVRPTLVRVLTDLYVQKRAHTAEEEHRFTELSLWLLAGVDVATRAAVARKLATYPEPPREVIRRLARDVIEVAEPVLRHAAGLTSDDLLTVIKEFGPRHAAIIGTRNTSPNASRAGDAEVVDAPFEQSVIDSAPSRDGQGTPAIPPSRPNDPRPDVSAAPASPLTGGHPAMRQREAPTLGERFLNAGSPERRQFLAKLEDESLVTGGPALPARDDDTIPLLEDAALHRRPDEFARILERTLGIPNHLAQQIVHDESGEPVTVAAKALAIPSDVLLRILLFLNARVGHSVERVFALVDLYEALSLPAALHIVASWQDDATDEKPTRQHRPLLWDDERSGARRTFASHDRRVMVQVPDGRTTKRIANGE